MSFMSNETGEAYWTDLAGVYRWDSMCNRPGLYRVIAMLSDDLRFFGITATAATQPYAVVDDFGNLVRVP